MQEHLNLLGLKVHDVVTGWNGVVTSINFDLFGCIQALLQPPTVTNEKGEQASGDGRWFDVNRLEVDDSRPVMRTPDFTSVAPPKVYAHGPADKPAKTQTPLP